MVFGRFRKPKAPVVLGSPQKHAGVPIQTPATPSSSRPPVLRNFSYPTGVGSSTRAPGHPASSRSTQSSWAQLGEICSFSPDGTPGVGQIDRSGREEPFFYRSDRSPYAPLPDRVGDADSPFPKEPQHLQAFVPAAHEDLKRRKRQRRSTLLPVSSSQTPNTQVGLSNVIKSHSLGDHIFPRKAAVASRFKRNSVGHHKTVSAFDAAPFAAAPRGSPERPASSSGVPFVDDRLGRSIHGMEATRAHDPTRHGGDAAVSRQAPKFPPLSPLPNMGSFHGKPRPDGPAISRWGTDENAMGQSRPPSASREPGPTDAARAMRKGKGKGKGAKAHWFSQIRDWTERRRKLRQSYWAGAGGSGGSRSSASQQSSAGGEVFEVFR